MDIADLAAKVRQWSDRELVVRRTFLFGSRVKGTALPTSDLDVAVQLSSRWGDSSEEATWVQNAGALRASLARVVPVQPHLHWYGGSQRTWPVHSGLSEAAVLVFDRDHTQLAVVLSERIAAGDRELLRGALTLFGILDTNADSPLLIAPHLESERALKAQLSQWQSEGLLSWGNATAA
jgi:predicted nucleotidyltransferase